MSRAMKVHREKMPSYREGQAIVCDEVVAYLSNFHQNRCHPEDGECSCWTEHQQKYFQSKAKALRELDTIPKRKRGAKR